MTWLDIPSHFDTLVTPAATPALTAPVPRCWPHPCPAALAACCRVPPCQGHSGAECGQAQPALCCCGFRAGEEPHGCSCRSFACPQPKVLWLGQAPTCAPLIHLPMEGSTRVWAGRRVNALGTRGEKTQLKSPFADDHRVRVS